MTPSNMALGIDQPPPTGLSYTIRTHISTSHFFFFLKSGKSAQRIIFYSSQSLPRLSFPPSQSSLGFLSALFLTLNPERSGFSAMGHLAVPHFPAPAPPVCFLQCHRYNKNRQQVAQLVNCWSPQGGEQLEVMRLIQSFFDKSNRSVCNLICLADFVVFIGSSA